jgi:dTDP-4-dehydrorhamnose reductase
VLLTGAGGMLAQALVRALPQRPTDIVALNREQLDVTDPTAVRRLLEHHRPRIVIQCAAFTRVDDAETDSALAFRVNAEGAANVAAACQRVGARFIYPSTDYVFDGESAEPYLPDSPPAPINVYGRSKLAGEQASRVCSDHLIVRTSWLYGAGGRNFVRTVVDKLRRREAMRVVEDQRGSPTWALDMAGALIALAQAETPPGVYHYCNAGNASWYEVAREVAQTIGAEPRIAACKTADYPTAARRPLNSVLDCSNTASLIGPPRNWKSALHIALKSESY